MNHYYISEAIGRGKFSTVYKGRKKKTIEYFAIKSVDKSQKSKVLQEVKILHSLDHPNVLKFYSWYETSAHLWLVLEYCVGGDLMSLLQQDKKLPEESIHDFAHDLVKALQFLHSKGIIYCDLKPSNILLDENGRTKLCDFGLSRKLSDISKTPSSLLPQAKRGTPFYMAPELFQDGGVHSYASDLWALGCVLYECYAGNPPFIGKEFTRLVKSILSDPTPSLPGTPSRPFVNLINSLLIKDPAERIQWTELCEHAFWRTKFTPLPLPPQPAFTDMIELLSKPYLSERNSDNPPQNKTPPKYREKDSKGGPKQDENCIVGSRGYVTPVKGVSSGRKIQMKASGKVVEEKQKDPSSNTGDVNLLRLSRMAKSNLQRENEKENYRRPLPNGSENDAEVKIENTDMELDFNENTEDETNDDPDGSDNPTCPEEKMSTQNQHEGKLEQMDNNNNTNQLDASPMINTPVSDDTRAPDLDLSSEHNEMGPTPPTVSPQLKRVKEGSEYALDSDTSKSSNDLTQVLWHPSDLSVRPVMPSRKADKMSIPSLPIDALPATDYVKMPKDQVDTFNNRIITILKGNTAIGEKQNVIRYLEMLSSNADAANILTNGSIMLVVVKMLRQSKASALRVQLASLIGLLIRHSTFIDDELANSGILGSLTDGLRDKQEKVRRFSMAALGELLFYISTQNEHNKDNNPPESPPSKDSRFSSGWQVSNPLISLVSSILRKGEDDVTQLYALRTIENICSQGGYWAARFTSQDVITNLCYIFRAAGKQESMRLTAGSCLVRLVRFNPPSIQQVMDKLPFRDTVSGFVKGSPREQQICLNLLNMAMIGSHMFTNIGRHLPLVEGKNLVPCLVALIEQGSEVLRGKALVFVALLCKHGKRWLPHFFCNAKLLSAVDRLAKEKDSYIQQCLDAFVHVVASTTPGLLEAITGDIQQMMGGRRPGHIAALNSRATPKTNFHLFPVIYQILVSSSFKRRVVTNQVLQQLANLIKLAESPFQGRDDFQITLLRVLESITEEPSVILESPNIFIREILPSLAVVYKGNKDGDARFLCLKIMFDVMVIFLSEPTEDEEQSLALKSISNTHFLPLYPTLIEDEDPIPMYAQKLLVMLIEFNYIKIPDILHLKIISQCFEFLLGDLSTANVNNVMLCLALASAPELESKILSQLKVVRRIGNLLEFVYAKEMEDFIEPTLGLCRAFLLRSINNRKGFIYAREPSLLGDGFSEGGGVVDQQQCIRDIMDFGSNVGVFLEMNLIFNYAYLPAHSHLSIFLHFSQSAKLPLTRNADPKPSQSLAPNVIDLTFISDPRLSLYLSLQSLFQTRNPRISQTAIMNHYHIYEAIGRGKFSTVYKGRKKKTIEYFAIKSVDKSQKSKVLQEVKILHSLDHPNVLKFYSWYETSAHLWLVLEYCVGGDLMSLLQQDKKLPEESIHDFAHDLVKALQFLHSKGIIYCDLKPSNILLDENGRTKLCDFGLSRKLSDISKIPSSLLPQAKRGTPFYMAPELFQDGGVHSYASDLWALGCVLYECYAGNPPFIGKEFTRLVKSILSDPTPSLPGTPSRPFVNLINSLLIKDPAERIQWTELCEHAFWRTKFTPLPLPPQPAFTDMIELLSKPYLSERNSDNPPQNKTPPKYREKDSKGGPKQDENCIVGSRGYVTPVKGVSSGRKIQMEASGKVVEEKQKDPSSNTRDVNLLRLSRMAKSNLQRENEKENYRRPLPNGSENDAEVKIENTDMELDFNENTEDETNDDPDGSDNPTCPEEKMSTQNQHEGKLEQMDNNNNTNQLDASPMINTPVSDDTRAPDLDLSSEHNEMGPTPPTVSPQLKRVKEGSEYALDSDTSKSSNDLTQVLWHPSDLSVRPVMPSRKADKMLIPSLPIDALPATDYVKMPKDQVDTFNNRIITILKGNTAIGEKQNVIRYLEMLSSNADAANILTNGSIMLVVVKMLRQSKASALRVQLASLIGLLIRHSTFIDDELANSGILGSLTDGLRDKQEKVRRFSMAALGELLFYISTQNEHNKDNNPPESPPSKDSRFSSGWQVSNPLISLVSSILRKGEDDVTQLYALRTIENICSQGGYWAARFTSQDVITNLCYIFRAAGKQESMRLTAGSCLVRLVRFNPPSIQQVMDKFPFRDTVSGFVKGSPREQQICLNLLNMAMIGSHMFTNIGRHLPLVEEKNLVPCLVALIEQGSEVLRGKALVFVALLCKHGKRWLPHFFCNAKLLSAVDRLAKEKDSYIQQCLDAFVHVVASTIPGLLEAITGDIQQMMGGRRRGHIAALNSRATPKTNFHLFPVIYQILVSSSFKRRVVTNQVLQQLANLIKLAESPFQGRDDFQITLLRVLESITEEPSVILESPNIFIREILPSLAVVYKGNKDWDARFLCLKIMFDVMVIFLNEPTEDEEQSLALKSISNTHFLPLYPTLIEDEDPIPMYAQKLLVMLIEFNYIKIPDILHLKIISQCFEFLLGDLSTANVNNVMLCLALASAPELESKILSQLKVVRRIGNLLELVYAKEMEDFIEPTLGFCRAFLLRSINNRKGFIYARINRKGFIYARIEVIVSELKSSSTPGVSDAAFSVALELQRLPRCI